MAKRKKKIKITQRISGPTVESQTKASAAVTREKVEEKSTSPQQERRTISPVTCFAGMFLCLVLGIYIGTLVTEMSRTKDVHFVKESEQENAKPEAHLNKEMKEVLAKLERKVEIAPNSASDWINLGNMYFDTHLPEKAITAYEQALKIAPKNADVWTDLGIMYREVKNFGKAVECFREANSLNPKHENALYNEGVVLLYDLHEKAAALAAWNKLLEINPLARTPQGISLEDVIKQTQ